MTDWEFKLEVALIQAQFKGLAFTMSTEALFGVISKVSSKLGKLRKSNQSAVHVFSKKSNVFESDPK